jgi:hypothetical protein
MPACNNTGIVTKRDVTCIAVAIDQLSQHVSAETQYTQQQKSVFCAVRAEEL